MPRSNTREVDTLLTALFTDFADRDYIACCRHVAELDALNRSRILPLFLIGVDLMVDDAPSLQLILIACIAHIRLGEWGPARNILTIRSMGGPGWVDTLLKLMLDETTADEVLSIARTDEQRLQAHYYAAERLLTDRDFAAALHRFRNCLEVPGSGPERSFAAARVNWLQEQVADR